jgi:hypothetical protein
MKTGQIKIVFLLNTAGEAPAAQALFQIKIVSTSSHYNPFFC